MRRFEFGSWDETYININFDGVPIIAIYIKHTSHDETYSVYRWDNIGHIKNLDLDYDGKLIIEGVDELW